MMPDRKAAFRRMHEQHFDAIARYCLRRLSTADAHDATSEVFLVAWRKFSSISDADETLLWLYGIARNVVRNLQRSGRRSARLRARVGSEPSYPAPALDVQIIRHEEDAMILAALARLRPDDQEVIRLRAYEELTIPQISLMLGCSVGAASKRVARALERLRKAANLGAPATAGVHPRAIQEGGER